MIVNNKFRASYSILNVWKSGDWERAIKYYFKLEKYISPAMADGINWHDKWEEHIRNTKTMPPEFGGMALKNPRPELKIVVQLQDWLELVCKIDNLDAPIIDEFKTGKRSSESYASSPQAGIYAVACTYKGMVTEKVNGQKVTKEWPGVYVDRAHIWHYDQYAKTHDMSVVWITDKLLNDTHNWIVTLASEMHDYFTKNDLYAKFGHNLNKQA